MRETWVRLVNDLERAGLVGHAREVEHLSLLPDAPPQPPGSVLHRCRALMAKNDPPFTISAWREDGYVVVAVRELGTLPHELPDVIGVWRKGFLSLDGPVSPKVHLALMELASTCRRGSRRTQTV